MPRIVRLLLAGGAAVVLLVASCLAYVGFRAQRAASRVEAFCASVAAGDPASGLARRATEQGFAVREFPAPDDESAPRPALLLVEDGVFLARHICSIEHAEGRVLRADKTFVD